MSREQRNQNGLNLKTMKQLLEDYKRRLETITIEIGTKFKHNCPDNPDYVRYRTKQSCYKTLIAEIERELEKEIKK